MISSAYVMELAVIGGSGGGPFDHRAATEQQGAGTLGCGARGMRLSRLHVEGWAVLSNVKATYALIKDPNGASVAVPATGNVRGRATEIEIAPDERVALLSCEHRFRSWDAGAHCLSALRLEIEGPGGRRRAALAVGYGQKRFADRAHRVPGHISETDGDLDVVAFPEGLTLAGIAGRAGDSWDQVRLLACPFLPEPAWAPALHRRCPPPFREQTRALLLSLARLSKCGGGGSSHDDKEGGGDGGGGTSGGDGACSAAGAALPQLVLEAVVGSLYDVTFFGEQGSGDDCIGRWMARQLPPPPSPPQPEGQQPAARGGRAPGSRWRGWGWGRGG